MALFFGLAHKSGEINVNYLKCTLLYSVFSLAFSFSLSILFLRELCMCQKKPFLEVLLMYKRKTSRERIFSIKCIMVLVASAFL